MSDLDRNLENGAPEDSPAGERGGFALWRCWRRRWRRGGSSPRSDERKQARSGWGGLAELAGDAGRTVAQFTARDSEPQESDRREKQIIALPDW